MKNESGYFEGRETTRLFYQYWLPESEKIKAYLIAFHPLGTHSDRIKIIAEYLTEKGYAIYAFDLRGHWRNIVNIPGHIESMDHLQKDIVLFMDVVREVAGDKKIFLLGLSFGGLIALTYAITHPQTDGVIALSPEIGVLKEISAAKKLAKKIARDPSALVPYEIDQKILTKDLKILKLYNTDKRRLKEISIKTYVDQEKTMKWVKNNAKNLSCSTLIMQAGDDRIVDKKIVKKFYDSVKTEDKTYKEYDGILHEIWSEKQRAQVFQDLFVWLEKHIK
jgi:alpha-beta hydrolase superfamily lysophospholipase